MLVDLTGQIERVTYWSQETTYTVARVRVRGRRDLVTVVGNIMSPTPGETLEMKGEWSVHPQYGEQFKIVSYRSVVPASVQGIRKYLGSGLIKGIGPIMAGRIVKSFGPKTLEVIDHEIDRLLEVEGVGRKRLEMIRRAWADQKEIRRVMVFLQDHGVSSGYAAKIFKRYGDQSVDVVRENPYRLAQDIFGIGFVTADGIAERLGLAKDSEVRVEAGILYVLLELSDEGHLYYPYQPLIDKAHEVLEVDRDLIVRALGTIAAREEIVIEDLNEDLSDFKENYKAVYLAGFHRAETGTAGRLGALIRSPKSTRRMDPDKAVAWVQERLALSLAERQIEAVRRAATDKLLVITGGPGTGKTTIIKAVLTIFSRLPAEVLLAAPTGRAAKRMSEATGFEAKTIHRLLEYSPREGGFKRNEALPLVCDLLVIDEASMIDAVLMYHLLKAVPQGATLILVGDVDQLPSVGPGNVLRDIITSGAARVVRLDEIFRQARESSIIVNAHGINQGRLPARRPAQGRLEDFYIIEQPDPEEALRTILELVYERIPARFGFDRVDDIQVLSPMHRGLVGASNLNAELQKTLNPESSGVTRGGREYRVGDKVMQIRNNYDKEVFNGDIGRIKAIDYEQREVMVRIDDRPVAYDFGELDELVLAYAVSIHKAQGSEYPAVVIPIMTQHYLLLQRNLLYTAVTRGRELVVLVGSHKALAVAVGNNKTERRYTRLAERLRPGKEE